MSDISRGCKRASNCTVVTSWIIAISAEVKLLQYQETPSRGPTACRGEMNCLSDHTCILRVGCHLWRRSSLEGGGKVIRKTSKDTRGGLMWSTRGRRKGTQREEVERYNPLSIHPPRGLHLKTHMIQLRERSVSATQMSCPSGAVPSTITLGLDLSGPWQQRSTQMYPLTSSENPPFPGGGGGGGGGGRGSHTPLRLPALVTTTKGPRERGRMTRLSVSEPSLITSNEYVHSEKSSSSYRPSVLQKRPPPLAPFSKSSILLSYKTRQPHQQKKGVYLHFSKAIQPRSKPRPARCHSHKPAPSTELIQGDPRPQGTSHGALIQGEVLSVVGKPCPLSCSQRPIQRTVTGPARTQLHVFLPTEAEGEEVDSESVDEGFMDELDNKITSLKLQQGAAKAVPLEEQLS
ncbi:uncharacterized protein LOC117828254 [Xyrichtys novacula]|uniref:Uncharacterized protein LOC117828254 n=1 Tax=Xyrichtys novacula TaxID=13765 RepID=A0AAV1HCE8_XYRNO|nr:uncharacterized protein LOC117828254 [Xyrichtys novacula]